MRGWSVRGQPGSEAWKEAGDSGTTGLGAPKGPCSRLALAGNWEPWGQRSTCTFSLYPDYLCFTMVTVTSECLYYQET